VFRNLVVGTALLVLFVGVAVASRPDTGTVLMLGAAALLAACAFSANRWANRRQREEAEASTQPRGTIAFTGWRNGGL
jgi:hypothetical protein